jgi:hypothetical protein
MFFRFGFIVIDDIDDSGIQFGDHHDHPTNRAEFTSLVVQSPVSYWISPLIGGLCYNVAPAPSYKLVEDMLEAP